MDDLFRGFEFIRAYIYNLLILTKGDCTYNVQKIELTLNKLKGQGIRRNIEKSLFGQTEMKCLVLWITRNGVKPTNDYGFW